MSDVIVEEELEMTSIVEVVQTRLAKNFTIILKKINKGGQDLQQHIQATHLKLQTSNEQIRKLEKTIEQQESNHLKSIQEMLGRMDRLEDRVSQKEEESRDLPDNIKRLNQELFHTQLQFEEKIKNKERELEEVSKNINILAMEQNRINDEINKKENKVEAEKIIKETSLLKDKNSHFENELKLATHKIEKIQILNQKAERMQAKKEIELMREIEERVKRDIKTNLQGSNARNLPQLNHTNSHNQQSTPLSHPTGTNLVSSTSTPKYPLPRTESYQSIKRLPSLVSEEQMLNTTNLGDSMGRNEVEHVIEKWSDKIRHFEVQFKEITENLKVLNRASNNKRVDSHNKENNSDAIKDKINQIKPELVKMWAKIDTIEDRLSFSERKTDQKFKGVNQLASLVKENSISKLDERLKNLQTEIFTNLKETKSKLQTKVGQTDYDKYRQNMEDRITQINDLISLKTDKLEVKKALFFLETKIKQIILVITEDQENEKDALLTKKQVKCISCDKEMDKFTGLASTLKGNWDTMPSKDHRPELLGRCGMNYYGTLNKKAKNKIVDKQLPSLHKKGMNSTSHSP